ncbi:MAG: hypothetical protein HC927_11520 [Deltaproteobacteria bacterium]|nr:hypothetical protein [Deltaproteobacteria bacterium]
MNKLTSEQILELLGGETTIEDPSAKQLLAMCQDPDVKISEGEVPRAILLQTYTIRRHHARGDEAVLSTIISVLESYEGDFVRIVAISTPRSAGGLLVTAEGTLLAVMANEYASNRRVRPR